MYKQCTCFSFIYSNHQSSPATPTAIMNAGLYNLLHTQNTRTHTQESLVLIDRNAMLFLCLERGDHRVHFSIIQRTCSSSSITHLRCRADKQVATD